MGDPYESRWELRSDGHIDVHYDGRFCVSEAILSMEQRTEIMCGVYGIDGTSVHVDNNNNGITVSVRDSGGRDISTYFCSPR